MEHIVEILYQGAEIWIFCMAVTLMFSCFSHMDKQTDYVKANIYEQHMLYGAEID